MQINFTVWNQTVEAARAAAANSPAWLRAIGKAVEQIHTNPCITELYNGVLITDANGCTYLANGVCQCKEFRRGTACWHRAAAKLINRYNDALNALAPTNPADERAELIADIKAVWSRKHQHEYLADALMFRFGCNKLEMLNDDFLRRIQVALE
jgi:hypothetical protein